MKAFGFIPHTIVLILSCFISISFINFPNDDVCKKCAYKGAIGVATSDSLTGNYLISTIQLGEMLFSIDIEDCIIKKKILILNGTISAPIPKKGRITSPVPSIYLLACNDKGGMLIVQDTLAISDNFGHFSIKTQVKKDKYIVIKQNITKGIVYSTYDFND